MTCLTEWMRTGDAVGERGERRTKEEGLEGWWLYSVWLLDLFWKIQRYKDDIRCEGVQRVIIITKTDRRR